MPNKKQFQRAIKKFREIGNPQSWEESFLVLYLLQLIVGLAPFKLTKSSNSGGYSASISLLGVTISLVHCFVYFSIAIKGSLANNVQDDITMLAYVAIEGLTYVTTAAIFINAFLSRKKMLILAKCLDRLDAIYDYSDRQHMYRQTFYTILKVLIVFLCFLLLLVVLVFKDFELTESGSWSNWELFIKVLPVIYTYMTAFQFCIFTYVAYWNFRHLNRIGTTILDEECAFFEY